MYLPQNIKYLRKKKGLTQKALSEKIGVASTVITGYEGGRINPSMDKLNLLVEFFQCSYDDLIMRDLSAEDTVPGNVAEDPESIYGHGLEDPVVRSLITYQQQQIIHLASMLEKILIERPELTQETKESLRKLILKHPHFKNHFDYLDEK